MKNKIQIIHRKLLKLWSQKVRERANYTCEYCGAKKGDKNKNGKPTIIDAHHLMSKYVKNCPLKFDILNGIALCKNCHKFGPISIHNNPIIILNKLDDERWNRILNCHKIRIDLDSLEILDKIEKELRCICEK